MKEQNLDQMITPNKKEYNLLPHGQIVRKTRKNVHKRGAIRRAQARTQAQARRSGLATSPKSAAI